ncbi:unnamed protein product [Staurois parvus]|uniref:Uncharacterized protein n=1 Tax=Staurois parvus TaxID=386267 RepID=A0ABN9HCU2_9NEOB|nr:unnamed protein product [Staurois parvus]
MSPRENSCSGDNPKLWIFFHFHPGADWHLMGPLGNRGSWGPSVLAQTQKSL